MTHQVNSQKRPDPFTKTLAIKAKTSTEKRRHIMLENFHEPHSQGNDIAKLILRLSLGILLLLHGMAKIQTPEIIIAMGADLADVYLPAETAWLMLLGEVLGPVLLIIGVLTRFAGAMIAIQMLVVILVSSANTVATFLPDGGYALELQAMYLFAGLTVAFLGSGSYAMVRD